MNIIDEMNYFYYHSAMYELQVMNENDYYEGLSYNSILYLNVICDTKECTVSKLADTLRITKSAVTIKVNELVRLGAVVKTQSDKDKRVFFLKLSPQMEKLSGIYNRIFEKIEGKLRQTYSQEELNLFGEILHTISGYEWSELKNE